MIAACPTCVAKAVTRAHTSATISAGAKGEPFQFVETYQCGAVLRWGYAQVAIVSCPIRVAGEAP